MKQEELLNKDRKVMKHRHEKAAFMIIILMIIIIIIIIRDVILKNERGEFDVMMPVSMSA